MDEYTHANQARWNELAPLHARSTFYDVASFKAGRNTLLPLERAELGDVAGKSLLHLQCHFGLDTLSWARLGARVTGVDFAENAIAQARALNDELGLDATFVAANIYDVPNLLAGAFDIVYASYGVLCWLGDLPAWGRVIAHFLKPGGRFYIAEDHPFASTFHSDTTGLHLDRRYPYFHSQASVSPAPVRDDYDGSYADPRAALTHRTSYEWPHTLGEIINALLEAGLRLDFLHEFPFCAWQRFPCMRQDDDGWWRLPQEWRDNLPLTFSLQAMKAPDEGAR